MAPKYRIYQHILCPFMQREGPSIKYVSTFLVIFDPSLPHVSNSQHFNTPSLKSTSAFARFPNPPPHLKLMYAFKWIKNAFKWIKNAVSGIIYNSDLKSTNIKQPQKWMPQKNLPKFALILKNTITFKMSSFFRPPPPSCQQMSAYGKPLPR